MIIAVDFDGTIAEHVFPQIGDPVPEAFVWMKKFQSLGAKLILWTMRSDGQPRSGDVLKAAVDFCRSRGVEFHGVNTNPDQTTWTNSPKAYAHVYIDDAAFGCPLTPGLMSGRMMVDWSVVGPRVVEMINQHFGR